ncbi:MAG: hypothetical protein ABSC17_05190 [Thermacetogeniaceae bacterium]
MRGNKLWEGHRIVLPEMREKAVHRCRECRFLVAIVGQEETRSGCVAGIAGFGELQRRVPEQIPLRELLHLAGRNGLQDVLTRGNPDTQACGRFQPRLKKSVKKP